MRKMWKRFTVNLFAAQGIGKAIMNRLEKAAGHTRLSAAEIAKRQKYRRIIFISGTDSARAPMAAEMLRHEDLAQEYVIDSRGDWSCCFPNRRIRKRRRS